MVGGTSWISLSVPDSGIGIPFDKLEHVFEEFSQVDESTSRDYDGRRLGLPISRRFCQMMGGDITMKSRAGEGSTFKIRLPLRVEADAQDAEPAVQVDEPPARLASRPTETKTVLVVDDTQALDLLGRTLEGAGMRVVAASDGCEVQRLARTLRPMALILDVKTLGMDGWEVLDRPKVDPEMRGIPVIIITMTDNRETGYVLGATES
jgi:CheY-like chemotaxis protein